MIFVVRLLITPWLLATAMLAFAEHKHEAITNIIVTANAVDAPGAHTVLESSLSSERVATSDSASLLQDVPGVSLVGAGAVSSLPAIHGLADDRLRIKVDGMDLVSACGNHMNPPLSYIDPSAIAIIDVYAGVTPVSMGGDSIGGTILVESREPQFAIRPGEIISSGELGAFYRSNGDSSGAHLSASAASQHIAVRYSGAFARANNYHAGGDFKDAGIAALGRGWLEADEVGSTAYETQNHKLGIAIQGDDRLTDLIAGYQHIPYQGFPNQRMDMLDNKSSQVALKHLSSYDWGKFETRIYNEQTRHKMNFGDDKQFWYGDASGMPMQTEAENTGLTLRTDYHLTDHQLLRIGSEVQWYTLDDWWPPSGSAGMMAPNTFWNIRDGQRDRFAVFGEWQSASTHQWVTLAGMRYERVNMDTANVQGYNAMMYGAEALAFNAKNRKRTDDNWDASLQLQYKPGKKQTWNFGLARKTRSPNLYERYSWSTVGMAMRMVNFAGDGNGYVGNLNLKPEVAHTVSVSANLHDASQEHWQLQITPFYTHVDNYIGASLCTTVMCNSSNSLAGFRYLTFSNDKSKLYGLDISGKRLLSSSAKLGEFFAHVKINYVRGKNDSTGDNLYNIMPLNAAFKLEQKRGILQNTVEWQIVSAKKDISQLRNEIETAGYGLLHMHSSAKWRKIRFDVGVENALDKSYDLPLGGAYTGQGMTMSAGGVPWGVAVPGAGRSLYAGVTYQF